MPELPEVETIARGLRGKILGKRIAEAWLSGFSLRRPIASDFASRIQGRRVTRILRRGKYLVVVLEPEASWLVHLGMSGRLLYHPRPMGVSPHTHVIIRFSDSSELEYRDPRRFGLMTLHEGVRPNLLPEIVALGEEPLSARFHAGQLGHLLRGSRQEIKSFLLQQEKIAGLGNIYVCEALFRAGIHPCRRCFTITAAEAQRLADSIKEVLRQAIRRRGTSLSDFVDSEGNPGGNQRFLAVYGREGRECVRCGVPVRKLTQGNRSTYYCQACQRREGR